MNELRKTLVRKAIQKSLEIRKNNELDIINPICVYDLCRKLNVKVRFIDINIEGIYVLEPKPSIIVSSLRPSGRRNFTCAHELGHHVFGHGSTIDELFLGISHQKNFQPDEFLANCFASFLLMPTLGLKKAFSIRNWSIQTATPEQFYTISCNFGVGYATLITHLTYALSELSVEKCNILLKLKPKNIFEKILGRPSSQRLIIADENWKLRTIDIEIGDELLIPKKVESERDSLIFIENNCNGDVFRANKTGIVRVYKHDSDWAYYVRISNRNFVGLSQYRHLEEIEDD